MEESNVQEDGCARTEFLRQCRRERCCRKQGVGQSSYRSGNPRHHGGKQAQSDRSYFLPFAYESGASAAIRQPQGCERQRREKQKRIAKVQTEKENSADRLVAAHMLQQDKSSS